MTARCPQPACPVRWRYGGDRPCADHEPARGLPDIGLGAVAYDGEQSPRPAVPGLDGVALSRLTAPSRVEGDRLANPSEGG
jgi:hypothetical protein